MSKKLRFDDHAAFHKQVLRVTLAGAAVGLIGHIIALFVRPGASVTLSVAQLAFTVAALGFAANPPNRKELFTVVPLGLGLALLGTLCMNALSAAPRAYPWFGLGIYGLAVGLIAGRDLKDHRRYVLPIATGLTMVLATWVNKTFAARIPFTDYMPAFAAAPIKGAVFGFLVSVGLVLRQVRLEHDRVMSEYERIKSELSGEMAELVEGAISTYGRIGEALRDREDKGRSTDPELTRGVETLMLKVLALGKRWQEVEREASRTSADTLTARIGELDKKIAASTDGVARRQYEMARDALRTQLKYVGGIAQSRERVLARVHGYLAALERVHLAVLNHQGADTAKFSDELSPLLESIDDMGLEMEIASEAMNEAAEAAFEMHTSDLVDAAGAAAATAAAPTDATTEAPAAKPVAEIAAGASKADAVAEAEIEGPPTRDQMAALIAKAEAQTPASEEADAESSLMRSAFN